MRDAPERTREPHVADVFAPAPSPVVDVVVPVFNEVRELERSIRRLHAYLTGRFPFSWRITIADNGSTDGTWFAASQLAGQLDGVHALHLDRKGRGLALRSAWIASDAAVVAYMDVDLSTDLDALLPLIAPLVSGHSDVAIGSRLAPGAAVARAPKREFISRAYNGLLRTVFATPVRDAQCGFKAVRADVARRLLPAIEDNAWFFDTELLLLAQHNGLRIHEVSVDWTDDPDSRVEVFRTARDDLAGVVRMARLFWTGRGHVDLGDAARPDVEDDFGRRLVLFGLIGLVSTAVSLVLFLLLRNTLGVVAANAVAVTATFVGNTWANARFTARRSAPNWLGAVALYAGSLCLTSVALLLVDAGGGGVAAQIAVLAATWMLAAVARLVVVSSWSR
jgi:glycosyltransferase involved in cell wall biosynthesis